MSIFIRRFLFDPGDDVLLEIESVNVLDLEPPASVSGTGTGHGHLVAEFEDGPFETPTEIFGSSDLLSTFGSLGVEYQSVVGYYPCAVSRKADGAAKAEYWNGNGFVQLNGKKFRRLSLTRVDTSVGYVELTRLAAVTGKADFRWKLNPAEVLSLKLDAGAFASTTFNATAAIMTAVGGVFPSTYAGGETITFEYDDGTQFTVTFLAADQTNAQVVSRINLFAGFTIADLSGGQVRLTGRAKGTAAYVKVVSANAPSTLTKIGLPVAGTIVNGTGNVANITQVTLAEIKSLVETTHGAANVEVYTDLTGKLVISNTATPGTGLLEVGPLTTATGLGFTVGAIGSAAAGVDGVIPAGTVVRDTGDTKRFVTMQSIDVTAAGAGPYQVKVRHALDDTTGTSATAGTIVTVEQALSVGAFGCVNPNLLTAALTEDQIDAQYATAIAKTLDPSSVCREVNVMWSARQSNAIRSSLKTNAQSASANGLYGRMVAVRPPLNTLKATAKSTAAAPGVGATRDQRVIYCYPQAQTYVPLIARRGTSGGVGFTATGLVDVGADGFMASVLSQLPPEENPGQETEFTNAITNIESGANVQGFEMSDYTAFKKAGIAALRMDGGKAVFQSGVTSVDPAVNGNLKNISRRRMADYVQDTLAKIAKPYGKKLMTLARRKALLGDIKVFLDSLLSTKAPAQQRIAGYTLSDKENTAAGLAKGLYRIVVKVKLLASFESIVIATTVGETVDVEELPAAA